MKKFLVSVTLEIDADNEGEAGDTACALMNGIVNNPIAGWSFQTVEPMERPDPSCPGQRPR